jgi:hypothetical protein
MGKSDNPLVLIGAVMNEEECLVAWKKSVRLSDVPCVLRSTSAEKMSSKLVGPMELGYTPWFAPRTMIQGMIAFALFKSTRRRRYLRWGLASISRIVDLVCIFHIPGLSL